MITDTELELFDIRVQEAIALGYALYSHVVDNVTTPIDTRYARPFEHVYRGLMFDDTDEYSAFVSQGVVDEYQSCSTVSVVAKQFAIGELGVLIDIPNTMGVDVTELLQELEDEATELRAIEDAIFDANLPSERLFKHTSSDFHADLDDLFDMMTRMRDYVYDEYEVILLERTTNFVVID